MHLQNYILCSGQLQRSHGDMMGRTLLGDRIKVERNKGWIGLQRGDRSWGRVWAVSRIHGTQSPSPGPCSAGDSANCAACAVQNFTTKGRQGGSHPLWTLDTVWQESGAMSSCFLGKNDKMAKLHNAFKWVRNAWMKYSDTWMLNVDEPAFWSYLIHNKRLKYFTFDICKWLILKSTACIMF